MIARAARIAPLGFVAVAAAVAVAAVASLAGAARANERVMVIVEETIGEARAANPLAEIRVSERLIAAGHLVTEAVETDKARGALSLDRLLGGAIGAEVTALNCDVLVVGRTVTVSEEIPYDVSGMSAVSTEWTVRAIGVDTGRVLATASGRTQGVGTQTQASAGEARKKAADQMFDAVAKAFASSAAPASAVSLTVSGVQEIGNVDALRGALAKVDGVRKVTLRFVSADETRLDVDVADLDTWAFAGKLRALGLEVAQVSRGAVRATWSPWGAGKKIVIATFENATGVDGHDWIETMLPEVFATELANSRYLRFVAGRPGVLDAARASDIARAAREAGADYIAGGALERLGDQLRLHVTVFGADGAAITAAQELTRESELVGRTRDLVWAIDARLFEKLFAKGSLQPYQAAFAGDAQGRKDGTGGKDARAPAGPIGPGGTGAANAAARPRPRVVSVALDDLFPARLAAYATRPVGKVVLANPGAVPITGVRVHVSVPGVTSAPAVMRVDDLGGGGQREVPITLVLERDKVQALRDNLPAQAEVRVTWDAGGGAEGGDLFTVPLVVFDKNAQDWSAPESVAVFVTHKDESLDLFARAAERDTRAALGDVYEGLRPALSLFEALGALGLTYQADAKNPFGVSSIDTVAFPGETLARKAGDCDDLSVLMAALLESQGVATTFVLTPGHILVLFDSGVAIAEATRLGLPASAIVERAGHAYVPIEVTRVGSSFADALSAGAAEIARHRDTPGALTFVDVAAAWKQWPPFPGVFTKVEPKLAGLAERATASVKALDALSGDLSNVPAADTSDDPAELNRIAVRLVQRGQWRRAEPYLQRARALDKKRRDVEYNLANLEVVAGDKVSARTTYEALRDVPELTSHSLHALAVLAYLDGKSQEAKALFERSGLPEAKKALTRLGLATPPKARAPKPGRKPVAPAPDPFLGVRAGVERVPLDELLLWLR